MYVYHSRMPSTLARLRRDSRPRVILYGRVSEDRRDGRSCTQQLSIGNRRAKTHGWDVVGEFSDNDMSASQYATKEREDWLKVEEQIRAGRADILWLWEISRGTRDRIVWAHLVEACQRHRMYIALDEDLWDTTNPDHMKYLDGLMIDSIHESGKTSKRARRNIEDQAEQGRPHGWVHYGYQREYDPKSGDLLRQVLHEEQAEVVRSIAGRLLDGEYATVIASDLNSRGVPTPKGRVAGQSYEKPSGEVVVSAGWDTRTLQQLLGSPTIMGRRGYHGRVMERGWPEIVTEMEWYRIQELLHPNTGKGDGQAHTRDGAAKYLVSGIGLCDICEARVWTQPGWQTSKRKVSDSYRCNGLYLGAPKGHVSRAVHQIDAAVEALLFERFDDPDVITVFDASAPSQQELAEASAKLRRLQGELDELYAEVESGQVSRQMAGADERRLKRQIEEQEELARPRLEDPWAAELAEGDPRAVWGDWGLSQRRSALRSLTREIRVLKVGRIGHRRLPASEQVQILWAGG